MGKINLLTQEVANLIAAGEVVDRPASVLKELMENAIDAGATAITAELRNGGVSLCRVSDNGCGISSEDLPIALQRHATSKIKEACDLDEIATLGFRGEALAAIAGVSVLEIVTRTQEAPFGTMLHAEYGQITEVSEVGCQNGTTVLVRELFGNVPARRKFLKKDATETATAASYAEKIALSHPEIAVTLIVDGETRFQTAGDGKLLSVIYAIEGREFANKLLPITAKLGSMEVSGFVGRSDHVRGNRNQQNMFINGRYIRSKTMVAALEQAFHSYIAPGKFPIGYLFLTITPGAVDVNVHPAKLEVRFSDERPVFEVVYHAVKGALTEAAYRPELAPSEKRAPSPFTRKEAAAPAASYGGQTLLTPKQSIEVLSTLSSVREKEEKPQEIAVKREEPTVASPEKDEARSLPQYTSPFAKAPTVKGEAPFVKVAAPACKVSYTNEPIKEEITKKTEPIEAGEAPATEPTEASQPVASLEEKNQETVVPYRLVGEAFSTYVIVEQGERLLLIDKHAAHERILYEKLLRERGKVGGTASQGLLLPMPVSVTAPEGAAAEEARGDLEAVGYSFSGKGNKLYLDAVPSLLSPEDAKDLFLEMLTSLSNGETDPALSSLSRQERALYSVACKAAIKGGRSYDEAHIVWLIEEVLKNPSVTVCPHGRPIAMTFTKNKLDREFNRIQH